jgi:hypothetical protein
MCYGCSGSGLGARVGTREQAERDGARREAARIKRFEVKEAARIKKIADRDSKIADWASQGNEDILEALKLHTDEDLGSSFLESMRSALYKFGSLTEKQTAAAHKVLDSRAAKAAAPVVAVITGRVVITGKVISTKSYETDYGTAYKMLVEDERGFRVFGSVPSNLWDEIEFLGSYRKIAWNETDGVMIKLVGMELTFTATVEQSQNDAGFGFFKRPAKAAIVE